MPALTSLSSTLSRTAVRPVGNVGLVLGGLTFAALWFILCRHLSGEWAVNEQYNYGWFVPIFALFLLWLRWDDRPEPRVGPSHRVTATVVAIVSLFLLLPIRIFEIGNPDWRLLSWVHAAIVVGLTLLWVWFVGGSAWLRHFAFPICFIFVAVPWISPIEQPIIQGLMRIVASVATEALTLIGIPAQMEGNLIRVSGGLVGVNEACSGVRSLQTSIMIGLLFGEMRRLSILSRLALVGGAVAIAMLANLLRAFILVWIAADKGFAEVSRWHDMAGYLIVAIVFVGSLVVAGQLARAQKSRPGQIQHGAQSGSDANSLSVIHPSFLLTALTWILLVEVAAVGWYRLHERNLRTTERWGIRWPESKPGFHEMKIEQGIKNTLRFDNGREVSWREIGSSLGERVTYLLFFFRWEPGNSTILRARAHRPDICLPSAGWRQIADNGVRTYSSGSNFLLPFRHFSFVRDTAGGQRPMFADAFFCLREDAVRRDEIAGNSPLASSNPGSWEREARWRVVREGIRNPGQQVMQFIIVSPHQVASAGLEERFAALLPSLIKFGGKTEL